MEIVTMRRVYGFLASAAVVFTAVFIVVAGCGRNTNHTTHETYKFSGITMGTLYNITLVDDGQARTPADRMQPVVDSVLAVVNAWMSTFDPESDISRFNAFRDTTGFQVAPEVVHVVRAALRVSRESDGAFDITVGPLVDLWGFGPDEDTPEMPSDAQIAQAKSRVGYTMLEITDGIHIRKTNPDVRIDLSAIAKGYGVDKVAEVIATHGYTSFLVDIGGEITARGKNAEGQSWKIGVDKPESGHAPGDEITDVLALTDMSVASSGDYRNYKEIQGKRYSHEIDPNTGKPVQNGMIGATVITGKCMLADAYATALMVMPVQKGLEMIERQHGIEVILYHNTGRGTFSATHSKGIGKYTEQPARR